MIKETETQRQKREEKEAMGKERILRHAKSLIDGIESGKMPRVVVAGAIHQILAGAALYCPDQMILVHGHNKKESEVPDPELITRTAKWLSKADAEIERAREEGNGS